MSKDDKLDICKMMIDKVGHLEAENEYAESLVKEKDEVIKRKRCIIAINNVVISALKREIGRRGCK